MYSYFIKTFSNLIENLYDVKTFFLFVLIFKNEGKF